MSPDTDAAESEATDEERVDRTTAPMDPFTGRAAGIGFVVFLVGMAIAFGVPLVVG